MDVVARPAPGRDVSPGDFADITTAAVTAIEWVDGGNLCVTFDGDLTDFQQLAVRLRITSATTEEEQLRRAAAAFLDATEPTLEDVVAQVRRITCLLLSLDDADRQP